MKALLLFLLCSILLLAGCSRPIGPAIVNASGATIEIVTEYDDGRRIEGMLADRRLLLAGRPDAHVVAFFVNVDGLSFSSASYDLRTPLGSDKWAAFVVRRGGLEKVPVESALKLTDAR